MNPKLLIMLLAALASRAQAEAQTKDETPCACPRCTLNRAVDGLLSARKAADDAKAEFDAAEQVADAADRKKHRAIEALSRAQSQFDAAADAFNAGSAQA